MALAVAQVGGNVTTGTDSISFTFGSSTTTGSLIAIVGHQYSSSGSAAGSNYTDNKSNTFQLAGASLGGLNTACISGGYNSGGTRGSSHQCTYNGPPSGGSDSNNIAGIEITGQDTTSSTSCFDSTTFATATDTTSAWTVTAAAAISGNQIAIYGVTIDTGTNTTFTQPTGYTNIINQGNGVTSLVSDAAYKINETGTPAPGATSSHTAGSGGAREIFMSFKEAGGAADTPWMRYRQNPRQVITPQVMRRRH